MRHGVWVAVGGGAVVLAAAAGLLAGKILFDDGIAGQPSVSAPTPAPVTLPEVTADTAAATLDYLDGDGRVLVELTDTADQVRTTAGDANPPDCQAMAGTLNDRYPFDTVLDRLHAVPDPVLGEWLSTYYGSAFGALDACAKRQASQDFLADADDALALVDKRLTQLREAR
jgi:hypothetical protein